MVLVHCSGDDVLRKTVDRYLALRGSTFDFWRWSVTNHLWNALAEVEGEGRVVNVNRLAQGGGRLVGRGGKVYQVRAPSEPNLSLILADMDLDASLIHRYAEAARII